MTWPSYLQSELLAAVADTTGAVVLALRPDHTVCYWNHSAERLYGLDAASALGVDYVHTFIAPELREAVASDICKVLSGTPTQDFEDQSVLPDGTRRTLVWNVKRFVNAAGEVCGVVASGHDITARQHAEAAFRLVWDQSAEGLLLGGGPGIVDCNPAALAMLGLTDRAQIIGRRPVEFSPEFQPDGMRSSEKSMLMDRITRDRDEHRFEWTHQKTDGTLVPTEVHVRRASLHGRTITVVAWHDLTEHHARAAREATLREQLLHAQKLDALGHLAGGIAHDFNNLLSALRGSVDLALMDVPEASPAAEELRIAQDTTVKAATLVRQLLAFGRQREASRAVLDLGELLRSTEPVFRRLLPATVGLSIELPAEPMFVWGDASQLEQVLVNLLVNARDAMGTGGDVRIRLACESRDGNDLARLTVSDSGRGIAPSLLERVFDPFFTTKAVGAGTGLGLSVVYSIVSAHDGLVQLESELGVGTRICIELPLTTDAAESPHATRSDAGHDGRSAELVERDAPAFVVLLVDDEPAVRGALARVLARGGHRVLEATHGAEALTVWYANMDVISLVVSDVRMPVMSGPEFVRQLWSVGCRAPVLLMSGFADAELTRDLPPSVREVLSKPFASEVLLRAVREARAHLEEQSRSTRGSSSVGEQGLPVEGGAR